MMFLCITNITNSQEWEVKETVNNDDESRFAFDEVLELSNGNLLTNSRFHYRSGFGDFYSFHPALSILSEEGSEIVRKNYFRPAYCSSSSFFFEKNEDLYMLTAYNPDHDYSYFNYFGNYENSPSDAILGLYKLDDDLNIVESHEHIYPIDVYEQTDSSEWQFLTNEYSGNIFLFNAFEDDGNITGAYFKMVSYAKEPRGHDTLFFFKMDFEGNILLKKPYEMHTSGGFAHSAYCSKQMVKTDSGYIFYTRGFTSEYHGTVEYYDNDFNRLDVKYIIQPEQDPINVESMMSDISVMRSNHNTTYVSTATRTYKDEKDDVRLYEFDDDINDNEDVLQIVNYIHRATDDYDRPAPHGGVDITNDDKVFLHIH